MRKILATLLAVCTVLSMLVVVPITATAESAAASTTVGYQAPARTVTSTTDGVIDLAEHDVTTGLTSGATYIIQNAEGLFRLADLVNNGKATAGSKIYITNNINVTDLEETSSYHSNDINFRGIGYLGSAFSGYFNGQGYTISNLKIYYSDGRTIFGGLFALVSGENTVVENVYMDGTCNIYVKDDNLTQMRSAGTVVGQLVDKAKVHNCYSAANMEVTVNVTHNWYAPGVGGIVGGAKDATTAITNCTYAGDLTNTYAGAKNVGGVVGYNYTGTLSGCVNAGKVKVTNGTQVGGITGYAHGGKVTNCENSDEVTVTTGSSIGGIIGFSNGPSLEGCQNSGKITLSGGGDPASVGGIVGYGNSSMGAYSAVNCKNSGEVRADSAKNGIGGIYGLAKGVVTIQNCENTGYISANGGLGGIIGNLFWATTVTIEGTENRGGVNAAGGWTVGGLLGTCTAGTPASLTVTGCANYGTVSGIKVGGFVGFIPTAVTIKDSANYGLVKGKSTEQASAIIGSAGSAVTLTNVRNYALITGTSVVTHEDLTDYSTTAQWHGYQTRDNGDGTVDLRFVGSVDNANYYRAGFRITMDGKTADFDVAYVYDTLTQEGGDDITTPEYRGDGAYLFAFVIKGINKDELKDHTFTVQTYTKKSAEADPVIGEGSSNAFTVTVQ